MLPLSAFSQSRYNVHVGVVGSFSAKVSILDRGKTTERYNPIGANQLCATLYIEDPYSFSLLLKAGITQEWDNYQANKSTGLKIATDQFSLTFNPEVMFPLSNPDFKLGLGIGVDYLFSKELIVNEESNGYINDTYYYGNMDQKQRKMMPFVTADVCYAVHKNVWLGLGIRQPVAGSYYKNETILFDNASFNLKHQPTYLSFSVYCKIF